MSIQSDLLKAVELTTALKLKPSEFICWRVDKYDISCHMTLSGLARVYRDLQVPRKKLKISPSGNGNLHIDFVARGVAWGCVVLQLDAQEFFAAIAQQQMTIEGPRSKRLQNRQPRLIPPALAAS